MKFDKTEVFNIEGALRGLRNPKESWSKSDSCFGIDCNDENVIARIPDGNYFVKLQQDGDYFTFASIGKNDMKLAQQLIRAGSEHRKFMRQIFVSVDITAPLYWWKEFDTYKVGTVANSTSTMHKLTSKPITLDCFEINDMVSFDELDNELTHNIEGYDANDYGYSFDDADNAIIEFAASIESMRQKYLATKDKRYWKELIRWLPESWLQTRTVTMTYENLFAMCSKGQRRFHKLNEWSGQDNPNLPNFISWARTLPYAQEFIFIDELEDEKQ